MSRAPVSRIRIPPVPAISGTTLSVLEDEGDCLPTPPFTALVFPSQTLPKLGPDFDAPERNAEEVQVTKVSLDEVTIERGEWPIPINASLMFAALQAQPTYQIGDPIQLDYTFPTDNPPYTLHLRNPQGGTTVTDAGGTAAYTGRATSGGQWRWLFEDADDLRSPEFGYFVYFSDVA
jgi:hypothetical protein